MGANCGPACALEFPGPAPGPAQAELSANRLSLSNNVLAVHWDLAPPVRQLVELRDEITSETVAPASPLFTLQLQDGRVIQAGQMSAPAAPQIERLPGNAQAVRACERFGGWRASLSLTTEDGQIQIVWRASLRDGANYIVQEILVDEPSRQRLQSVTLIDALCQGAEVAGTVDGSPVLAGGLFLAAEDPLAKNTVRDGRAVCTVACAAAPGVADWRCRASLGVLPREQRRRAFLYYVERERARPYQLFVHYNSWWDIAWGDRKMNEAECLDVIRGFGEPLTRARGVALDSFCFDDGWDDNRTLWKFHSGFPQGFTPLRDVAESYRSHLGVWLSPWGGYGKPKAERMQYGATQGFETNDNGFSLAGPGYYARFREACLGMIRDYGCNYFKFDGIASGVGAPGAGEQFAPDVAALLRLIGDLRAERPDLFVNVTTGTWPSPYWLWFGDSIWRNGDDVGFHGAGTIRQQSITYRDMHTYRMIVQRAPLYPLNSLMICSVVFAQRGTAEKMNYEVGDFIDEVRMAYAGGTQCLELYLTPRLMQPAGWDALAETTNWARQRAEILVDSHWVGGDPGLAQAYGYAGWSSRGGILALRNPSDQPQTLALSLTSAWQLPDSAPREYALKSPWSADTGQPELRLKVHEEHAFELRPFETRVLEGTPVASSQ
jgi:hypothetical protein